MTFDLLKERERRDTHCSIIVIIVIILMGQCESFILLATGLHRYRCDDATVCVNRVRAFLASAIPPANPKWRTLGTVEAALSGESVSQSEQTENVFSELARFMNHSRTRNLQTLRGRGTSTGEQKCGKWNERFGASGCGDWD
jgi:hypothetical protein